jgi:hypothetical protein
MPADSQVIKAPEQQLKKLGLPVFKSIVCRFDQITVHLNRLTVHRLFINILIPSEKPVPNEAC